MQEGYAVRVHVSCILCIITLSFKNVGVISIDNSKIIPHISRVTTSVMVNVQTYLIKVCFDMSKGPSSLLIDVPMRGLLSNLIKMSIGCMSLSSVAHDTAWR